MQVTVSRRHTEVPESLRVMAEEKIGRLGRFVDGLDHAEVHFWEHKNPRIADKEVCEVTIEGHGHHVRCKVQAPDGFQAIDKAYEKLEHQLHKLKTKLSPPQPRPTEGPQEGRRPGRGRRDRARASSIVGRRRVDEFVEPVPQIVKSKRFAIHPMAAEEAAERMELLGHGFFFFTNVETSRSAVVYRRDDGNVGLIDEAD